MLGFKKFLGLPCGAKHFGAPPTRSHDRGREEGANRNFPSWSPPLTPFGAPSTPLAPPPLSIWRPPTPLAPPLPIWRPSHPIWRPPPNAISCPPFTFHTAPTSFSRMQNTFFTHPFCRPPPHFGAPPHLILAPLCLVLVGSWPTGPTLQHATVAEECFSDKLFYARNWL